MSEEQPEKSVKRKGPLILPVTKEIGEIVIDLLQDANARVKELTETISCDPVLVMELLKCSNSVQKSSSGTIVTSPKRAVLSLGMDSIRDVITSAIERSPDVSADAEHWMDVIRTRSQRVGDIAHLIAGGVDPSVADSCFSAGLLMYVGELVALVKFGDAYVSILEEFSKRSQIRYRLQRDHNFDAEVEGVNYLRGAGVPQIIYSTLQREERSNSRQANVMKNICFSAAEMVEAYETGKWESIGPGNSLPPKSSIRMLQLKDPQYKTLYTKVEDYLKSGELEDVDEITAAEEEEFMTATNSEGGDNSAEVEQDPEAKYELDDEGAALEALLNFSASDEDGHGVEESEEGSAIFGEQEEGERKVVKRIAPPALRAKIAAAKRSEQTFTSFVEVFEQMESIQDLLATLLDLLVESGPFSRSALLLVSTEDRKAQTVASSGEFASNKDALDQLDPLSPLLRTSPTNQTFPTVRCEVAPFGSKTFALGEIQINNANPIVLYADCGEKGTLGFEARKMFRKIVATVNEMVPSLPGQALFDEEEDEEGTEGELAEAQAADPAE